MADQFTPEELRISRRYLDSQIQRLGRNLTYMPKRYHPRVQAERDVLVKFYNLISAQLESVNEYETQEAIAKQEGQS